jgi:nicotinamide phosphoribosyltransferase
LVACVSDSFNIIRACEEYWGKELREEILARDGTLVVRPDSGEPVATVLTVLEALGRAFGTTINAKGYKVLPPQVRVIQGDGIDFPTLRAILAAMETNRWSTDNIAFGSGGGLLQKMDRDTLQFAFKCSAIDGEYQGEAFARDVYKNPSDAKANKASKRGRLALVRDPVSGGLQTWPVIKGESRDEMREVFRNGEMLVHDSFDSIRARAAL